MCIRDRFDATQTMVLPLDNGTTQVQVVSWYDNENSYTCLLYTSHYRRYFTLPEGFVKEKVLLHFGAVDQECHVYLNGRSVGSHKGGYPVSYTHLDVYKRQPASM